MTEREKRARIKELWAEIIQLYSSFRSDWHRGFDAALRIDLYEYGDKVKIRTEEELGVDPPRADYMVLVDEGDVKLKKEIFQIFRKYNVIEYKNPEDSLNDRVLRKICGYGNMFIGTAVHEGEIPADQVTLSIFRYKQNKKLFRRMMKEGSLIKDSVSGIYHVKGMTDLPFQIVIMQELDGDQYAAYRALTRGANEKDIRKVIAGSSEASDTVREYYRTLLDLLMQKNAETMKQIEEDKMIGDGDALMELLKDRIDEKIKDAVSEAKSETEKAKSETEKAKSEAEKAEKRAKKAEKALETSKLQEIRRVMKAFSYTIQQSLDFTEVPVSEQPRYRALLKESGEDYTAEDKHDATD